MPTILLVDDEPGNLELGAELVAAEGYKPITAPDGEQAIRAVQDYRPDLAILDIVMPKMNGIELCRRIKTNPLSYAMPVIMVTALTSTEDKLKAIRAGADDFLTKPFDRVELAARLRSLLRLKAIHDRLESSLATLREMQQAREELLIRAVRDVNGPLNAISDCLQSVASEQHLLPPDVSQKIEPALFCVDMVGSMAGDFANIMRLEQDKLRLAYEALKNEQAAATKQQQQQQ